MAEVSHSGQMDASAYRRQMQQDVDRLLDDVAAAVNAAPDGAWIEGSEEPVRDAVARFRIQAYQTALQMRTDAAEAAFSPSAPRRRPAGAQQGAALSQRADG